MIVAPPTYHHPAEALNVPELDLKAGAGEEDENADAPISIHLGELDVSTKFGNVFADELHSKFLQVRVVPSTL